MTQICTPTIVRSAHSRRTSGTSRSASAEAPRAPPAIGARACVAAGWAAMRERPACAATMSSSGSCTCTGAAGSRRRWLISGVRAGACLERGAEAAQKAKHACQKQERFGTSSDPALALHAAAISSRMHA